MQITSFKTTAIASFVLCAATPALADLTAREVWSDWKTYMESFGFEITHAETATVDGLKISDFSMNLTMQDISGAMTWTIPVIAFEELGNGSVGIALSPTSTMRFLAELPEGPLDMGVDFTAVDLAMTASGDADNITYDYTANEMQAVVTGLSSAEDIEIGAIDMALQGLSGQSIVQSAEIRTITQKLAARALELNMDVKDLESGADIVVKSRAEDMVTEATTIIPQGLDAGDFAGMMAAGFDTYGTMEFGAYAVTSNTSGDVPSVGVNSTTAQTSLGFAFGQDGVLYEGKAEDMNIAVTGFIPMELAMESSNFRLKMPLSETDEVTDFGVALGMQNFTMSDFLWGLFDPGAQLPRDPASLALDVSGTGKLSVDLFDVEALENVSDTPGELESLTLKTLNVDAAGAKLTGDGAFIFDNNDTETFDGVPAPTGAVNLKLTGGNGLLEKLIAMGLIPQEQAIGIRLMMGLFTRPGEGADTLTSTVEIRDGQVLANGQRLR